ncbi:hypothetical protein C2G38_2162453 [Gigaspora rosea]|uniref:Peptidase S1 domain-containing protein n=1 Tax=Gigaspora rosea TaxID=44941 RepID=A0A397VYC2_9GLOM|nr:hypothetical protein C2G38_2162453 [Gigaspora rosea]
MVTKNRYILINLLTTLFMLINHSIIHAKHEHEPLARYWEVPVEKVPDLLTIEENLIMVDSILKPILDNLNFGGTYINAKENKVFINTVNSSMIPIVKSTPEIKPYIDLLSFLNATKSSYQLNTTFNELIILAQELNAYNVEIGINPKFNNIVIDLNHEDDEEWVIFPNLLCGDGLHDGDGKSICSVGLNVRDSNGQDYIMTAGHCGTRSPRNQQGFVDLYQKGWFSPPTYRYVGPLEYYSSNQTYDFGLIRVIGTNVSLSTIISNLDQFPNIYALLFIKDDSVITSVGASICKSGHKTHVTCGEVLELNFATAIRNINTNQTVIKIEMIKTNLKGGPGDSGGIVYTYSTNQSVFVSVVGTMVGGSTKRSYFLPLPLSLEFLGQIII